MGAPTTAGRRLDSLTGLRAFAALAVFGRHVPFFARPSISRHIVGQGAAGVSFFFLLSGFVLAWSQRSDDRTSSFYRRRFARIYPAYLVSMLIAAAVNSAHVTVGKFVLAALLLQNWSSDPNVVFGVNAVGWSLSCEAFFYLLFPFVYRRIAVVPGRRRGAMIGVLVALAVLIPSVLRTNSEATGHRFLAIYAFPPTRFVEFLIGMLLALALRDGWRPRISLNPACAIALCVYALDGWVPVYLMWVAVPLLPFMLVIVAAASRDIEGTSSWSRSKILIKLGEWSYAFYLLHQIVINQIVKVASISSSPRAVAVAALALAASVVAAALLFNMIERPFERRLRPDNTLRVNAGGTGSGEPDAVAPGRPDPEAG